MPPFTPEDPRRIRVTFASRARWIRSRPMIAQANRIMGPEQQKRFALAEIQEAEQELERSPMHMREASIETADVAWFVLTYLSLIQEGRHNAHLLDLDEHDLQYGINGQGNASNRFDLLKEYIGNMEPRFAEHDVIEVFRLLTSIAHHIPEPLSLIDAIELAIKKNKKNRPISAYKIPQGRSRDEGRFMSVYQRTERQMRNLRDLGINEKVRKVEELVTLSDIPPYVAVSLIREISASRVQ